MTITFLKEKQDREKESEVKEIILWENIFQKREKGLIEVVVPMHELMRKADREVHIKISSISGFEQNRKIL